MAYTWWAPDLAATRDRLNLYRAQAEKDGFGAWTAVLKESEQVVGWGGLISDPVDPGWGNEVSYFIHSDQWGHGFASEIVDAALALAFDELDLREIVAFAHVENRASVRVLEKAGFRFHRFVAELDRNEYTLTPETWLRRLP